MRFGLIRCGWLRRSTRGVGGSALAGLAVTAMMVVTAAPAGAESYTTWAGTMAEACAEAAGRVVSDLPNVAMTVANTSCVNVNRPVEDTIEAGSAFGELVLGTAAVASPDDVVDALSGVEVLQAASLTDLELRFNASLTNPTVTVGVASALLGVKLGYRVGVDKDDVEKMTTTFLDPGVAAGCLSASCSVPLSLVFLQQEPGEPSSGGNSLHKMKPYDSLGLVYKGNTTGRQFYYWFITDYKWRADFDHYASSQDASVGPDKHKYLKKIYSHLAPGRHVQLVNGAPKGVSTYGESAGTTTIAANLAGEVGGKKAGGGVDIGISRSYERFEGKSGGGYLHDGTHFATWIAGNKAGIREHKAIDAVTTWSVPSNGCAHWIWDAYVVSRK